MDVVHYIWCIISLEEDSSFQLKQGAYNFFLCFVWIQGLRRLLVQVDCLGAWAKLPQQHMSVNTTGEQFQKCGKTWLDLQQQGVLQKWSNFFLKEGALHLKWDILLIIVSEIIFLLLVLDWKISVQVRDISDALLLYADCHFVCHDEASEIAAP